MEKEESKETKGTKVSQAAILGGITSVGIFISRAFGTKPFLWYMGVVGGIAALIGIPFLIFCLVTWLKEKPAQITCNRCGRRVPNRPICLYCKCSTVNETARTLGILSLIMGGISLPLLSWLFGPAAIVCGIIAGTKGYKRGWLGMAFGLIGVIIWSVLLAMACHEADAPTTIYFSGIVTFF